MSLGEARAAVARACIEKMSTDPSIETDILGDDLQVFVHLLAEIGNLVDEGDLHGEEGVARIFDQLGGLEVGEEHAGIVEFQRAGGSAKHLAGVVALDAADDAIGSEEILESRALPEEFRVGDDLDTQIRAHLLEQLRKSAAGADRHRGLRDHHRVVPQFAADRLGRAENIAEVGMAVAPPRRRAHGDEHDLGLGDPGAEVGAEAHSPRLDVAAEDRLQPGFVDRHDTLFEHRYLVGILIDADHVVAEFGKAGARHETDIAATDDRDLHPSSFAERQMRRADGYGHGLTWKIHQGRAL